MSLNIKKEHEDRILEISTLLHSIHRRREYLYIKLILALLFGICIWFLIYRYSASLDFLVYLLSSTAVILGLVYFYKRYFDIETIREVKLKLLFPSTIIALLPLLFGFTGLYKSNVKHFGDLNAVEFFKLACISLNEEAIDNVEITNLKKDRHSVHHIFALDKSKSVVSKENIAWANMISDYLNENLKQHIGVNFKLDAILENKNNYNGLDVGKLYILYLLCKDYEKNEMRTNSTFSIWEIGNEGRISSISDSVSFRQISSTGIRSVFEYFSIIKADEDWTNFPDVFSKISYYINHQQREKVDFVITIASDFEVSLNYTNNQDVIEDTIINSISEYPSNIPLNFIELGKKRNHLLFDIIKEHEGDFYNNITFIDTKNYNTAYAFDAFTPYIPNNYKIKFYYRPEKLKSIVKLYSKNSNNGSNINSHNLLLGLKDENQSIFKLKIHEIDNKGNLKKHQNFKKYTGKNFAENTIHPVIKTSDNFLIGKKINEGSGYSLTYECSEKIRQDCFPELLKDRKRLNIYDFQDNVKYLVKMTFVPLINKGMVQFFFTVLLGTNILWIAYFKLGLIHLKQEKKNLEQEHVFLQSVT